MGESVRSWAERLRELAEEAERMEPQAPPLATVPLVTEAKLSELTGRTERSLEGLRTRGDVTEGVHYSRDPKGKIGWDVEAFRAWQRGVPDQAIQESRSDQAAA